MIFAVFDLDVYGDVCDAEFYEADYRAAGTALYCLTTVGFGCEGMQMGHLSSVLFGGNLLIRFFECWLNEAAINNGFDVNRLVFVKQD